MDSSFGQSLRHLRRSQEVTQRALADQVGVDFSYISKVENDRLPPPAADTVVKICEALGVPAEELLALTGKVPTSVQEMLGTSPAALQFLREAHELKLTEEEWAGLTQRLKRLRRE
jgi:transcriptional regulator with XRE-family HTH domain